MTLSDREIWRRREVIRASSSQTEAAERLDLTPQSVSYFIQRYGLDPEPDEETGGEDETGLEERVDTVESLVEEAVDRLSDLSSTMSEYTDKDTENLQLVVQRANRLEARVEALEELLNPPEDVSPPVWEDGELHLEGHMRRIGGRALLVAHVTGDLPEKLAGPGWADGRRRVRLVARPHDEDGGGA